MAWKAKEKGKEKGRPRLVDSGKWQGFGGLFSMISD